MASGDVTEYDDFGLPVRKYTSPTTTDQIAQDAAPSEPPAKATTPDPALTRASDADQPKPKAQPNIQPTPSDLSTPEKKKVSSKSKEDASASASDSDDFQDAQSTPVRDTDPERHAAREDRPEPEPEPERKSETTAAHDDVSNKRVEEAGKSSNIETEQGSEDLPPSTAATTEELNKAAKRRSVALQDNSTAAKKGKDVQAIAGPSVKEAEKNKQDHVDDKPPSAPTPGHKRDASVASAASGPSNHVSEFSHQHLTAAKEDVEDKEDEEWQAMPAYAAYDIYDDDNRLIAREHDVDQDEKYTYGGLGGAGKGYTRVLDDDDAQSETSFDDNTRYLFKDPKSTSAVDADEDARDAMTQLQATKHLLTEGQRVAYVGLTRLALIELVEKAESIDGPRKVKKEVQMAAEAIRMWSQKIMIRLYAHMDISPAEQVMIEQLAAHGVMPVDLTPVLMQNSRVKNPMAPASPTTPRQPPISPRPSTSSPGSTQEHGKNTIDGDDDREDGREKDEPPPYETNDDGEMPDVKMPSQLPDTADLDIDLRWTVLCDLFLVLIADSVYDARSRVLLERVGSELEVPWIDICKFEKRVTDALEMQEAAEKENWNEQEHIENRQKKALKRRYVMMGLATAGGGLVIGLSAGLMAPLIGAGLAAGFTAIGVGGTSSFLAGAGGAAIITTSAAASGSLVGGRAANRRTGAVKTFEYRPLHNNKRVNLVVTISGWMTSTNDDVRLPFSTVNPVMGDLYSVLWEPEMLRSMGDTINIIATEAVTQTLQQALGATVLMSLMAALQLPLVLTKLAYLVDNPWSVSLDRAWSAGLILADSLIDRNLGTRPITLVGYSLGARVIFSCLLELAKKGALGIVQNVYLFGSPLVIKREEYLRCRTVVAGRFLNGYNSTDWILGYLFRLTNGGIRRVAGLTTVEDVPGIENMNCSELVNGHMDYRTQMPRLLRECGWLVESDEFVEIEDPDPDRHQERQREIINEIEEARREQEREAAAAASAKKGGWGSIFSRKKKRERADWEVYEESKGPAGGDPSRTEDKHGNNHGVLFDVEAMRAELAREGVDPTEDEKQLLQAKELTTTLPPMKLEVGSGGNPRDSLRGTRSAEATPTIHSSGSFEPTMSPSGTVADDRTPTLSSSRGPSGSFQPQDTRGFGGGQDELEMTFDTAFDEPRSSSTTSSPPPPPPAKDHTASSRPEIRTANTVPNVALKDPWAEDDHDDPEFGKEKEIEMTFA